MWMCLEVQLPATAIGYVCVELRCREIRVSEHFLNRPQIGSALEEVGRERMAQQVRGDTLGLEARDLRETPEDEEGAGACERAALRVEEELGAVAPVEVRPSAGEIAAKRIDGFPPDGDDALLRALSDRAHEPSLEIDAGALEPD